MVYKGIIEPIPASICWSSRRLSQQIFVGLQDVLKINKMFTRISVLILGLLRKSVSKESISNESIFHESQVNPKCIN